MAKTRGKKVHDRWVVPLQDLLALPLPILQISSKAHLVMNDVGGCLLKSER